MRIAVFSDIHGNYQALKAIVNDIKKNNINEIVCLGDIVGIGPSPKQCLDLIFKENIKYVLGNHELYQIYGTSIDDELGSDEVLHQNWIKKSIGEEYVEKLRCQKIKLSLNVLNKRITFFHFFQDKGKYPFYDLNILNEKRNEIFSNENADYVFFGHEHGEHYYEINDKKYYCVGSSGCNKNNETFYHIITITSDVDVKYEKRIINYDRESFENTLSNAKYPDREILSRIFFGI